MWEFPTDVLTVLAIIASDVPTTVFGQRVEFTVAWPDGAPFDKTDEEFREWASRYVDGRRLR